MFRNNKAFHRHPAPTAARRHHSTYVLSWWKPIVVLMTWVVQGGSCAYDWQAHGVGVTRHVRRCRITSPGMRGLITRIFWLRLLENVSTCAFRYFLLVPSFGNIYLVILPQWMWCTRYRIITGLVLIAWLCRVYLVVSNIYIIININHNTCDPWFKSSLVEISKFCKIVGCV